MPDEKEGGHVTTGITVNSGCLNPQLLKGRKGGRIWPMARLRDRIDAITAHEWFSSDVKELRELIEKVGGAEELTELIGQLSGLLGKYGVFGLGELIQAIG